VRAVASSAELAAATTAARKAGRLVGFHPTMGALHAGHRANLAHARREVGLLVASIFVNPLQFGPREDLATYPRDLDADLGICAAEGVDLVFVPSEREMWPRPPGVRLCVGDLAQRLEGVYRPGHFDGVATVVAKLFNLVGPCRAYFGEKDAQQLAVVRRMVADLGFPQVIVACPTVREPDGLALSSRNAYLSAGQRRAAPVLHRALEAGLTAWRDGERDPAAVERVAVKLVETEPAVELQYLALVEPDGFTPPATAEAGQVLAVAASLGAVRLIDNLVLR
jgi:pantoate--beta-alanine ligase